MNEHNAREIPPGQLLATVLDQLGKASPKDARGVSELAAMLPPIPDDLLGPELNDMLQRAANAARNPQAVSDAMHRASQFVRGHTKETIAYLGCLFLNSTEVVSCPMEPMTDQLLRLFTTKVVPHSELHASMPAMPSRVPHPLGGTRPVAQDSGIKNRGNAGSWSLSLRLFFWVGTALYSLENLVHMGLLDSIMRSVRGTESLREKAERAVAEEREEKWHLVTSIFPDLKTYLRIVPAEEQTKELTSICQMPGAVPDSDSEGSAEVCWRHRKANNSDDLDAESGSLWTLVSAPRIITGFAFLILTTSVVQTPRCEPRGPDFQCTAGPTVGSMCVNVCSANATQRLVAFPKPAVSGVSFCGSDAQWYHDERCVFAPINSCYSDELQNVRFALAAGSTTFSTLQDAKSACNGMPTCDGVAKDLGEPYRLYRRNTGDDLVYTDTSFWLKGACTSPFQRYRSLH